MALPVSDDFRSPLEAGFYERFQRVGFNTARFVDPQINYGYDLLGLFQGSGLEPLLTVPGSYNANFVRLFYCNLIPSSDVPVARSFVQGREVEFGVDQLANIFGIPGNGEPDLRSPLLDEEGEGWEAVNLEVSGVADSVHNQEVRRMTRDPYLIQFILRHCLFVKAGDKVHINSTLVLATFFCLRRRRFNMALALMQSILSLTEARTKRQPSNLAYGHLIQVILQRLYNIVPAQGDDTRVLALQKTSVSRVLKLFQGDGTRRRAGAAEAEEEEEVQQQPRRARRAEGGGDSGGHSGASPQRSASSATRISHMEEQVRAMDASGVFSPADMSAFASDLRRLRRARESAAASQAREERHLERLERRFSAYHQAWCAHFNLPDPTAGAAPGSPDGGGDDPSASQRF